MKYYSTQRPIGPGTYPRQYGIEEIHNFDSRVFCEDIGRRAWGFLITEKEIPESELDEWELVSGERRTWWRVSVTAGDEDVSAAVTGTKESVKRPEAEEEEKDGRTVFHEWFGSRKEAEDYVKDAAG